MAETPDEISLLGIGPLGSLVQTVGAVAVIRQNNSASAELVLGSSLSAFNQTCAFTTVQIDQFTSAYNPGYLAPMSGRIGIAGSDADGSLGGSLGRIEFFDNTILNVDEVVYNFVLSALVSSGAVETTQDNVFGNCSGVNIGNLPSIQIDFDGPAGILVLFPEDYVDVTFPGLCRLQIERGNDISYVGLFKLSNLNIRISSDRQIQICDSI